ncbi:MAG: peptide-methionine (S)-S-oxide reductase MsrA [Acidimicrobiaceae bacterium]|jgi:peptide-methionine (S)-S-oxide reductase|nr:peptide-methionine (S)-S-oxide reductase MsrA [Acidimicrobiaceae bacterium]MBT6371575.1 peptide-methionine (S)-S-oxide reductase MsrA [Acidimicrobiaceae bacterium]MDG1465201.1 peptide-methionine (S)-S-oxide reductase MsrA [Acidimicrobiales bacterium]
MFGHKPLSVPDPADALPGRPDAMAVPAAHFVNGRPLVGPFVDGIETVIVGMGCFWGAERMFWDTPGVWTTAVGYAGGHTPNPTYEEVCSGYTGHNEVVLVAWETTAIDLTSVLRVFWENHDPTQLMRQGNDVGTQYRSEIHVADTAQRATAEATRNDFAPRLAEAGYDEIVTGIVDRSEFFYAEEYHQQYLAKNPMGYCGLGGTGVSCPIGVTG